MKGLVSLSGSFRTKHILNISMKVMPGEHGLATVDFYMNENEYNIYSQLDMYCNIDILVDAQIVFSGIVTNRTVKKCGVNYYEGTITIYTHSILADYNKCERSYQDVSMSYLDVMQQVANINTVEDLSATINIPIIQYMETAWNFVKRMSSRMGYCIYPDYIGNTDTIFVGLPSSRETVVENTNDYEMGIAPNYYTKAHGTGKRSDYIFYRYYATQYHPIGTKVIFNGKELYIYEISADLSHGELVFHYAVGKKKIVSQSLISNYDLVGRTILGTVLETQNETVKVHLDIDDAQDKTTAYPFYWTPDSGNVMYCMPKIGTRVSLYYGDTDEKPGTIIHCVRTNGGGACFSKPKEKELTTENGKVLKLGEDTITISNDLKEQIDTAVKLFDNDQILIKSKNVIDIVADQKVILEAKNNILYIAESCEDLSRVQAIRPDVLICDGTRDTTSFSEIRSLFSLTENCDLIAYDVVRMELKARCKYPRINDAPKEFDHKKWISNYLWGMAAAFIGAVLTTAALVAVGVLSVATCGVGGIIAVGVIGAMAGMGVVTSIAINDIQHGEVSSLGKYFFGGLICGAIGSALAGLGVYLNTVGAGIAEAKLAIYRQSALKIFDTGLAGMFQKGMFALTIDLPVSTIASSIFTGPPDPDALTVDMLLCFIFPNLPTPEGITATSKGHTGWKAVVDIFWAFIQDLYGRDIDEDGYNFDAPNEVIGEYLAN